jgi:two-component system NtrC family sensor kinase
MTEPQHAGFRSSLALKLALAMAVSTALFLFVLGYLNLRLNRQNSEELVVQSADRISDLIRRSTHYQMLRNDREALYHVIGTIGAEPGIRRIRIFNEEGRISVSTDPAEVNTFVDKRAEACYGCHAPEARTGQPLAKLPRNDRARIFTDAQGQRVLGVIRPIENEPACSNAACHAHPPDRRVLGVIDTDLSLATVDARLAEHQAHLTRFTGLILLLITGVSMVFIWLVVYRPVRELRAGTQRLAAGDLSYRLPVRSADELGELASSFNKMAGELADARANLTAWARTLETRVKEKTRALERAHEYAVQMEKMASVGRLAAVVAHEINNPLSGILTYTKLLKKWLGQNELDAARREEVRSSLELVECESRRCGEIVRNLLTFARAAPINLEWSDLNAVVERAIKLLQHQFDLAGVQLQLELAEKLPPVRCDASQIEQVLLALMMNAADAMPRGGILWLRSKKLPDAAEVRLEVQDDGLGIPADVLPHIFEPFFTTKENKRSVGLGLAVSHGIVQRHGGRIEVESEPGRGTKFTVILPLQLEPTATSKEPQASRPVSEVHQHA